MLMSQKMMSAGLPTVLALFVVVGADASGNSTVSMPNRAVEVGIIGNFGPINGMGNWMAGGGAVADFNNNGLPDIFLLTGGHMPSGASEHLPDRLYINQGDGTFVDEALSWGWTQVHGGCGASAADFNSNGYVDIYVTSFGNIEDGEFTPGRNKLLRNNSGASFTNVADQAGVAWIHPQFPCGFGSAWGDYNVNGHLDLYVGCWWSPAPPGSDTLFRNNGDGTFTDVTVEAGVFDPSVWGFQPAFVDMNGNGWPDLLVAADFKTSKYYRNNGDGTFTNLAAHPTGDDWPGNGTGVDSNGMGHAVADMNNNGLLDWYVTSIYPSVHAPYDGNMLYRNQGDHLYIEVSKQSGVYDGAWGWATLAVDFDHKGRVDLVEANGRPAPPWNNQPYRLFYNQGTDTNGNPVFSEIASGSGMGFGDDSRGMARIDADRDGRQDLIAMNLGQPWRYFRNESADVGNWIGISFDTSNNPLLAPNGYGAHVTIVAGGQSQVRYMHGDPSYLATSELNVHFGLGNARTIDSITILWPRGYVTTLTNVAVNQYLHASSPAPGDFNGDGVVNGFDLLQLLSKWGTVTSALDLHADLNNDGVVNGFDLLELLSEWGASR